MYSPFAVLPGLFSTFSRESVENLAGEIEAIDGRIQENEVRNAAAEQTVADREGEAASCRVQAEAILSGQSELLAQS